MCLGCGGVGVGGGWKEVGMRSDRREGEKRPKADEDAYAYASTQGWHHA